MRKIADALRLKAKRFDAGEDVSPHVDWTKARRLNVEAKRVNVDFPA